MTFTFENQLSLIIKSGVDLNLLRSRHQFCCSAVVLHLLSLILNSFHRAVVKFSKGAVKFYFNFARALCQLLPLATEGIRKHAPLQV